MANLVFSPKWFYGIDSIFEVTSVVVTVLLCMAAFKFYKFSKEARYKYFAWSFLSIALGFVAKILTNITIYYQVLEHRNLGFITVTYTITRYSEFFYILGFLTYRILTLLGFLGILYLAEKNPSKRMMVMLTYCLFVIMLFSTQSFYLFHITSSLLLILILTHYLSNYRRLKTRNTLLVLVSFALILLSQITFVFMAMQPILYVVAESIQLAGYLVLLANFVILVFHNEKNKVRNRK